MTDTSLGKFVVDNIFDFREGAIKRDQSFFEQPENVVAFRDFVQALPYVWVGQQNINGQHLAGLKPANGLAL